MSLGFVDVPAARPYVGLFDRVTDAVLKEFPDITLEDMRGPRRWRHVVVPRQLSMWLIRELGIPPSIGRNPYSYPRVARMFSGRDHTTVMHAIARVTQYRETDPDFRDLSDRLLAELRAKVMRPSIDDMSDSGELPMARPLA